MVEGGGGRHGWAGEGAPGGQPGSKSDNRMLPDNHPGGTVDGSRAEAGEQPVGKQAAAVWAAAARLLSLPQGERAREIVGAQTAIGKRLAAALSYSWTATEETELCEVPLPFEAKMAQEERENAMEEAAAE